MLELKRISGRAAEIGDDFKILRFLPQRQQRMIGAWCFLDHAGPVEFGNGQGMHVGIHPHIGLQTFTWMLEGEVLHRDSLGNQQIIRPGQVNLMTAGHGIAHTEDSMPGSQRIHAAQLWLALPEDSTGIAPAFQHCPDLPRWQQQGHSLTLLAGRFANYVSPCQVYSPVLGLDVAASVAGKLSLPLNSDYEYGILALKGKFQTGSQEFDETELLYLAPGASSIELELEASTKLLIIGGLPFAKPVLIWWNFVGYDKALIAEAQHQWEQQDSRFGGVAHPSAQRLTAPPLLWRLESSESVKPATLI